MTNYQLAHQKALQIALYNGLPTNEPTIIYRACDLYPSFNWSRFFGWLFIFFTLGGGLAFSFPFLKMEYANWRTQSQPVVVIPSALPEFNPLIAPDGSDITPVNNDFSLIIPSIGVNAPIVPGVNPLSQNGYTAALLKGVAHSSTSFYPNENGTVYLFSHSTNYEWFVKDLNAVFYLLKNVKAGDYVVLMYLGNRYTYTIRESKIIKANEISYLVPQTGKRNLILQTCWPPGTSYQRLLIFADLVEEKVYSKFTNNPINTNNQITQ